MNRRFVLIITLYFIGLIMVICSLIAIGDTLGYQRGYEEGFKACIEENNLYDRYEEYLKRRY